MHPIMRSLKAEEAAGKEKGEQREGSRDGGATALFKRTTHPRVHYSLSCKAGTDWTKTTMVSIGTTSFAYRPLPPHAQVVEKFVSSNPE